MLASHVQLSGCSQHKSIAHLGSRHRRPFTANVSVRASEEAFATNGGNGGTATRDTTIHRLIRENGCLLAPGVYDSLSAKICEKSGHKAAFLSGYAVSATLLGEPDLGLLTPPEMARRAGLVCVSVPRVPVLCDADTGGGNVLNVKRTVRQLVAAGCKGCFIEDQQWPKRAGYLRNKECIDMGEFASKIAAAREAAGGADFFIVARTDARATSAKYGLEDAITRANLYIDAGADASFVEAPRSTEELVEIGRATKGLRVCNMVEGGATPLHTPQELQAMGFHLVIYPLGPLYAATKAMSDAYNTLATKGSTRDCLSQLSQLDEFNELIGLERAVADEERLTRRESGDKLAVRVRAPVKPATN